MVNGRYRYLADVLAMDQCRPARTLRDASPGGRRSDSNAAAVSAAWEANLRHHPDSAFAEFILQGLREGFRIGFDYSRRDCRSSRRNMSSARSHPQVISRYVQEELSQRRLVAPGSVTRHVQLSPLGAIPKPRQPGKWRLIVDLSSPRGASVNDGIDPHLCSLSYVRIDEAAARIIEMGTGTQLAKLDLQNAYRFVPVHPDDQPLLGVRWQGTVLLDAALPFGLRSAPKIFTAVADAMLWVMYNRGLTSGFHYLDDFLFFGAPESRECKDNLDVALSSCVALRVPVAAHKVEGPATLLTFLGIEIDTVAGVLRLPEAKLAHLRHLLSIWSSRRCGTKRDLLSLIGYLHHAASIIKPGRIFVRRLIDLSAVPKALHHFVRLSEAARADIAWWTTFATRWNGLGFLSALGQTRPSVLVQSDASGCWGCGAKCERAWLQWQWSKDWVQLPIALKEMLPVTLAALTWGQHWQGRQVCFESDNTTVVSALRSYSCRQPGIMGLLRVLHFAAAEHRFTFTSRHIPGSLNTIADAISRNYALQEFQATGQLYRDPTPLKPEVLILLRDPQPDWMSVAWKALLESCLQQA